MGWKIINRQTLDSRKWDQQVDQFANGLPYSYSWYLDLVCSSWEAAILGDYEAICALPFNRKKFGFKQLYTPFFVQQLGWISKIKLNEEKVSALLSMIKRRYTFIHYTLNEANLESINDLRSIQRKTNLILDLAKNYDVLRSSYSKGLKYSINKANKEKLAISESNSYSQDLQILLKSKLKAKAKNLGKEQFKIIDQLIQYCLNNDIGKLYTVQSSAEELLGFAFFLFHPQRMINLFQASNQTGRKHNAISFLFDHLIKENAGKNIIFDFEGSTIPSVQRFMKSFGVVEKPYPVMTKTWV